MLLDAATRVHKRDLETVVGSVFSTMMALEVWPADTRFSGSAGLLTGAVYLTGEWDGAVCIHCGPAQACDFAARFLSAPTPQSVDDDVRDVIGELANMIAGNLKCTFAPGIRVSIPSVTDGADYSLRICGDHLVCRTGFHTEAGPLWVTLIESVETR